MCLVEAQEVVGQYHSCTPIRSSQTAICEHKRPKVAGLTRFWPDIMPGSIEVNTAGFDPAEGRAVRPWASVA